jgi:YD repeat-containing protein
VASFTYDTAGRHTALALPNGVITDYTCDVASRLTGVGCGPETLRKLKPTSLTVAGRPPAGVNLEPLAPGQAAPLAASQHVRIAAGRGEGLDEVLVHERLVVNRVQLITPGHLMNVGSRKPSSSWVARIGARSRWFECTLAEGSSAPKGSPTCRRVSQRFGLDEQEARRGGPCSTCGVSETSGSGAP